MKAGSRPQYYRIRRMVQMVREGTETGYLANSSAFMKEFEVSRRTVARDLDFLRDEERAPLAVYITERQWHPTQEFRARPEGRVEMRLETTGRKELVRWVLSWMPDVKVLAPKSLRDRIVEKLQDGLQAQQ